MTNEKHWKENYEARLKAWRDHYSRMLYAENKGKAEGRAEGRAESKAQIEQLEAKNEQLEAEKKRLEAENKAQLEQLRRELARFQQN